MRRALWGGFPKGFAAVFRGFAIGCFFGLFFYCPWRAEPPGSRRRSEGCATIGVCPVRRPICCVESRPENREGPFPRPFFFLIFGCFNRHYFLSLSFGRAFSAIFKGYFQGVFWGCFMAIFGAVVFPSFPRFPRAALLLCPPPFLRRPRGPRPGAFSGRGGRTRKWFPWAFCPGP